MVHPAGGHRAVALALRRARRYWDIGHRARCRVLKPVGALTLALVVLLGTSTALDPGEPLGQLSPPTLPPLTAGPRLLLPLPQAPAPRPEALLDRLDDLAEDDSADAAQDRAAGESSAAPSRSRTPRPRSRTERVATPRPTREPRPTATPRASPQRPAERPSPATSRGARPTPQNEGPGARDTGDAHRPLESPRSIGRGALRKRSGADRAHRPSP